MYKRILVLLAAGIAVFVSATTAIASIPAHPRWQSSNTEGTWQHQGYLFQNDMWSCPQPACGKQTIWANSTNDWGVQATMAAGNTAVLTYPDIGKMYSDRPVSQFTQISDVFGESMQHVGGLSAEAANDVWLNHWNIEMMIWTDNAGRSLAGGTRIGSATIFGQHFNVWKYGSTEFIFALNHNETSGHTHILASLGWLMRHNYVPRNATLTEVEYGWELASTGGHVASFHMSRFGLTTRLR